MSGEQRHILVIDDNQEILLTLEIMLTRKNYRVSLKEKFDNFEATVTDLKPDLILLDKSLGYTDGTILCRQIKSDGELSHIPVIMFSAYYKKKDECLEAGANDFIEKPFAMQYLLDKVAEHIDASQRA